MEKVKLEILIREKKSTREIAKILNSSQTNVRYWLKKYGLETTPEKSYRCKCGETDPSKFYGHKKRICGKCHNRDNLKRCRERRQKAIEYLGGKCVNPDCAGWKYQSSLDIHHKDPSKKDSCFRNMRSWNWKRIQKELKHCVLLCRNCHSALHNNEWIL